MAVSERQAQLLNEIQDRIEEYMSLNAEKPAVITGWVLHAKGITEDHGLTRSLWLAPEEQDIFTSLGLASALEMTVQGQFMEADAGFGEDE